MGKGVRLLHLQKNIWHKLIELEESVLWLACSHGPIRGHLISLDQSQLPGVDVVAVDLRVGQEVVGEVEQDHPEDKQTHEDGSLPWLTIGNLTITSL